MKKTPLTQAEIDYYFIRFRQPEPLIKGVLQRADIWQVGTDGLSAITVVALQATSNYLEYKVAIRTVFDYIDYLESHMELKKEDIQYSRKTVNDTEIITITFSK